MTIKKEYLVLLLSLFLLSFNAHSRLLVEPSFKYTSATASLKGDDSQVEGQSVNLNVGYTSRYFMLGFTGAKSKLTFDSTLLGDKEFNGGGLGTFLGFQFFGRFRVLTTYLNSTLESVENDDYRYFGQYASLSFGYRVYRGWMISLEFFRNQYTQLEDDTTGKTSGLESNIKTEGQKYNVSYVFVF